MVAARTVAGLAGLLLKISAGIVQRDFSHARLGEFFKLRGVTGFADFISDVGGLFRRLTLCRPERMGKEEKGEPD